MDSNAYLGWAILVECTNGNLLGTCGFYMELHPTKHYFSRPSNELKKIPATGGFFLIGAQNGFRYETRGRSKASRMSDTVSEHRTEQQSR